MAILVLKIEPELCFPSINGCLTTVSTPRFSRPPSVVSLPNPCDEQDPGYIELNVEIQFPPITMPLPLPKPPPGPSFILRQIFSWEFASYTASVYYLVCVGNRALSLSIPGWVVVSCSIPSLPCIIFALAQYRYWRDKREATSLGARLAPMIPRRLPGGIDLIATLMETFRTGYIGE